MLKIFKNFFIVFLTITVLSHELQARQIYFGSETEVVTLAAGGPTIFRFPSEVRTISQATGFTIHPADQRQPNYAVLSVEPKSSSGSSNVIFILNDGTVVRTKLQVVSKYEPERTDGLYDFKPKETLMKESGESESGTDMSAMDLMKALLRGDEVTGYTIRGLSEEMTPGFKGVTTKIFRIYTGSKFNGYVFELSRNSKKQKLFINIQNLSLGDPNVALLSSVDQPVLDNDNPKTYLRIVAKPTSVYRKLVLPIEVVEKK